MPSRLPMSTEILCAALEEATYHGYSQARSASYTPTKSWFLWVQACCSTAEMLTFHRALHDWFPCSHTAELPRCVPARCMASGQLRGSYSHARVATSLYLSRLLLVQVQRDVPCP